MGGWWVGVGGGGVRWGGGGRLVGLGGEAGAGGRGGGGVGGAGAGAGVGEDFIHTIRYVTNAFIIADTKCFVKWCLPPILHKDWLVDDGFKHSNQHVFNHPKIHFFA